MIKPLKFFAYKMALENKPPFTTGSILSVKAREPEVYMSNISESCSPLRPFESAPYGMTFNPNPLPELIQKSISVF